MSDYVALSRRAQIHRIRRVACAALADYDVAVRRLRLVAHEYNTTFRVDAADGRTFALRVNVNGHATPSALDAELAWLAALARDTDISVPAPHPTRSGRLRTSVWCDELERELPAVLMTWLPGRNLGTGDRESVRALGRLMARLHVHATDWTPPAGAGFPSAAPVLMDVPDRLAADHPALDETAHAVLAEARRVVQRVHDELFDLAPVHAIHADLHGGNVKWFRKRIAVFDFDDAAIGVAAQDLGISVYYLRAGSGENGDRLVDELVAGYAEVRSPPLVGSDRLEALLAGRNLILVNDVIGGIGSCDRDFGTAYVRNTVTKLRAFLDSGEYRHDVPGLLPISI